MSEGLSRFAKGPHSFPDDALPTGLIGKNVWIARACHPRPHRGAPGLARRPEEQAIHDASLRAATQQLSTVAVSAKSGRGEALRPLKQSGEVEA